MLHSQCSSGGFSARRRAQRLAETRECTTTTLPDLILDWLAERRSRFADWFRSLWHESAQKTALNARRRLMFEPMEGRTLLSVCPLPIPPQGVDTQNSTAFIVPASAAASGFPPVVDVAAGGYALTVNVSQGTPAKVVPLPDVLRDGSGLPEFANYQVIADSNELLFAAPPVASAPGNLAVRFATDVVGVANLTVEATGPGGKTADCTVTINVLAQSLVTVASGPNSLPNGSDLASTRALSQLLTNDVPAAPQAASLPTVQVQEDSDPTSVSLSAAFPDTDGSASKATYQIVEKPTPDCLPPRPLMPPTNNSYLATNQLRLAPPGYLSRSSTQASPSLRRP
jgi:hypothetical protein